MITKSNLESYKAQSIDDVNIEELKDISQIVVNQDKPVMEKILAFMAEIGNPYLFRVGNTPVKVSFTEDSPTLQKSLETIFTKTNR